MFGDKKEKEVKEAFEKVKLDIFNLGREISDIRREMLDIKDQLKLLVTSKNTDFYENSTQDYPTHNPTDELENSTITDIPTHNPTVPVEVRGLKDQNMGISMRNGGVPTDRQTNQQTDNSPQFNHFPQFSEHQQSSIKTLNQNLQDASTIMASLDGIKKEIRLQFKSITHQEMLVFTTLYQLEEQFQEGVEYRQIASKLGLSESSIRDYIQKLIGKGIPVDKYKLNNKKILLKISNNLKNIATLDTLIKLREL